MFKILNSVLNSTNVEQLLDNQGILKGQTFEGIFKSLILMDFFRHIDMSNYIYFEGKVENNTHKEVRNIINNILETKINNGSKDGISDITLKNKKVYLYIL